MKERKYSFPRFLGIIGIGIIVFLIGFGVVSNVVSNNTEKYKPLKGLAYTREAYIPSCTKVAIESSGVDEATATAYCGCVYDQGVTTYGVERFSQMDRELSDTQEVTPEVNSLINGCLAQLGAQ